MNVINIINNALIHLIYIYLHTQMYTQSVDICN